MSFIPSSALLSGHSHLAAISPGWWLGMEVALVLVALGIGWGLSRALQRRTGQWEESEERYRALFENALEGVYETAPEGGFRRANPAMARILGYPSVEAMLKAPPEQTAAMYLSPTRRDEFFTTLGTGDHVTNFESEIRRPDGSTMWIKESVRAVRDAKGRLLYLQGFASDITARRQAEEALRATEERFRVLFEHSPIGMLECDYRSSIDWLDQRRAEGVEDLPAWLAEHPDATDDVLRRVAIVGANAAALKLMGASTVEEMLAGFTRILTGETLGVRREMLLGAWTRRNEAEGEFALHALDGVVRRVFYHWWTPQLDNQPSFARTQFALVDVTDIRRAEAALAAERERLSVTLRAMTEGVVTVDVEGRVQFMNEAAGRLTGWSPQESVGRPLAEICVLQHAQAAWVATASLAALAGGQPVNLPRETRLQPRIGQMRLVEGQCAPIREAGGQALGAVLVLRDVTESSRLEAEVIRASKLQSVGVLAGGIAHDFNNLLSIVMGNITLALLDEKTAAAGGRWLREAERGTLRARELTQQLLTFAKGGDPVRAAVRLPDIVREAAEFALHGTAVRCEFDLAPDLRAADVDKGQIGQVVHNLVINAVQAMPNGGVIRLGLRNDSLGQGALPLPAGDYVRLEVTDNGHGIPAENLPRVFEPFFTTKEHGSGLGLATVYSIVRKHSGHVSVESAPGTGTVFRVWLPPARLEPPSTARSNHPFDSIKGRVLFMDDEEPIRIMTRALLQRLGMEVVLTADGSEAVQHYADAMLSGKPFDVVIMDLTVPGGMGGAQAMQEILRLDPQARGIVSSGYSSDPVMANFRAHGFCGMVPKPYRITDFSRTIREALGR